MAPNPLLNPLPTLLIVALLDPLPTLLIVALDESLADLVAILDYDFDQIARELRKVFGRDSVCRTCCAAFVLKPALLSLELLMRLARLAQKEFQISIVFLSSFDSGIGLAYSAIFAAVSDN